MTTAILGVAKSMLARFEILIETAIVSSLIEGLEFITILTLPLLIPFIIMYLSTEYRIVCGIKGIMTQEEIQEKIELVCLVSIFCLSLFGVSPSL